MVKNQNPSAVRSRAMLRQAMLTLLQQTPYEQITVTALCEQAQLGRKTFYRHYDGRDGVLHEYLNELAEGFIAALKPYMPFSDEMFARTMFTYWKPHAELFCLLDIRGQYRFVQQAFDRIVGTVGAGFDAEEEQKDAVFLRYCSGYVSGGCHALLRNWMRSGTAESVEQMTALFCRIRRLKA